MGPRWLRILSVILMLSVLTRSGQAQYRAKYPLPNGAIPNVMGVNIHFTDPRPGEMEQLAAAGFKWIRMDFTWAAVERVKGQYGFAPFDRLMGQLKRFGIRPIFILDYGNDLYQQGSPRSPEARAAFARFAAASVSHFQGQGVVWEMWNEPNGGFWLPKADVEEYIALALETGKAIRKVSADEWYVGPGIAGMDFPFLQRCLKAGLLNYWDAVSFHPYRNMPPETAAADFAHVRELMERAAPDRKNIPIVSSEWGYSELYPGLNRERQSWYIARQTLSNLVHGLRISIWYDWHDDGTDAKEAEHHFGTVFSDYREKETYRAAQTLSKVLDGFVYNKRLALNSPEDYCLLFTRGQEVRLAAWTTSRTPHAVEIPASVGSFRLVSYLGVSSNTAATADGLRLTLTEAPVYILPNKRDPLLAVAAAWSALPPYMRFGDKGSIDTFLGLTRDLGPGKRGEILVQKLIGGDTATSGFRSVLTMPLTNSKVVRIPDKLPTLVDRSDIPQRYRAVFAVKGQRSIAQETELVARDPIHVTVLPPILNVLPVQISRMSRKGWRGRVNVVVEGKRYRKAVSLWSEMPSTRVQVVLNESPHPNSTIRVTLEEESSRGPIVIVTLPPVRFQTVLQFEGFTPAGGIPVQVAKVVPDGDPKVASNVDFTLTEAPPGLNLPGFHAAKITYDFALGWKFLRVTAEGTLHEPLRGEPDTLGMWIHSDGSGDALRARFTDATGQTFQPDAGNLDWKGWRYINFPLRGSGGHWGGADDGKVHYPIHLDTLLLVDSPGGRGGKGEVYFTNVALTYAGQK